MSDDIGPPNSLHNLRRGRLTRDPSQAAALDLNQSGRRINGLSRGHPAESRESRPAGNDRYLIGVAALVDELCLAGGHRLHDGPTLLLLHRFDDGPLNHIALFARRCFVHRSRGHKALFAFLRFGDVADLIVAGVTHDRFINRPLHDVTLFAHRRFLDRLEDRKAALAGLRFPDRHLFGDFDLIENGLALRLVASDLPLFVNGLASQAICRRAA